MVPQDELQPAWTLILGPGPQMDLVRVMAAGLAPRHGSVRLVASKTPLPEGPAPTARGKLVLHTDEIEAQHLPALQGFLEQQSGWELVLIHCGTGPHLARDLTGPSYVHWWPSPLSLSQTQYLFEPPGARRAARLGVGLAAAPAEGGWHRPAQAPQPELPISEEPPAGWPLVHPETGPFRDRPTAQTPEFRDKEGEMGAIQAILAGSFSPETEDALPHPLEATARTHEAPQQQAPQEERPSSLPPSHPFRAVVDRDLPSLEGFEPQPGEPQPGEPGTREAVTGELGPDAPRTEHRRQDDPQDFEEPGPGSRSLRSTGSQTFQASPAGRHPVEVLRPPAPEREPGEDDSFASALLTALGAPPARPPMEPASESQALQAEPPSASQTVSSPKGNQPPSWYRDQVADLSDLAQRLHLDLFAIEESHGPSGSPALGALREDVARLTQFTRTLGYVAAAPGPGQQDISLGTLVQEQLATLAGLGTSAPRFLFKGSEDLRVRSDKGLLVGAFDAILQVAAQCAGSHPQTVRVACVREGDWAYLTVEFPPGPLAASEADEVFIPYRLKEALPSIGPNALSAARSILRGQGGDLRWDREGPEPSEDDLCAFLARLPLQNPASNDSD